MKFKKNIWIAGLLLGAAFPSTTHAQEKGDTKIVVALADTSNLSNRIMSSFYEEGYNLEFRNQVEWRISTSEKQILNRNSSLKIDVYLKGNTIEFSGAIASNHTENLFARKTFGAVRFGSQQSSPMQTAWAEIENIAKRFGSLTYTK